MKREQLKEILLKYYSESAVYHILRGIRKPSYEIILDMSQQHNIPFDIWRDIKSYLQENGTKQPPQHATAKGA